MIPEIEQMDQMDQMPSASTKKKRRNKSDLGPNFVAPDGGWGWAVSIAAGFAFFFTLPPIMLFGLIFRDHLLQLGLTNTEITTLINAQLAVSSCTGLFNGPMFRMLTFRQVALLGSIIITIGLLSTSFSNSFITYLLTFSILYGFGLGISMSASLLAVNTYFNEKRRAAAGIQWTISGLGPIVMPYVATLLLSVYGVQGSVIIFSGIAFNATICGTIFKPVPRLAEKRDKLKTIDEQGTPLIDICEHCRAANRLSAYKHVYISNDEKVSTTKSDAYCSINPTDNIVQNFADINSDTTNLSRANDGRNKEGDELRNDTIKQKIQTCTCSAERRVLMNEINGNAAKKVEDIESLSFHQKIVAFFDLDLLKDFTFLNLMVGLTTAHFAEMNYIILTPFILRDYGLDQTQVANIMALLAVTDISLRITIPFIVGRIGWQNKTFFLVGAIVSAFGRIVVAHSRNYYILLAISAWNGLGRAFIIVFVTLVIPSHVSLTRLAAASGLQLLFRGIFTLAVGPLIGKITDASNYTVTLHCLNIASYWAVLSWWLEDIYRKRKKKAATERNENLKVVKP